MDMSNTDQKNERNNHYSPFDKMTFDYKSCFLCGRPIKDNNSVEHIFPKWLLHRFNLWDNQLVLLNRTTIQYKNLTIPCCKGCNNVHLSKIETIIKDAVEHGVDVLRNVDNLIIFQWTAKIFYGLFFKELSLLLDRKNPSEGTIITGEILKSFNLLHDYLQSIIYPVEFHCFQENTYPWSIYTFKLQSFGDERDFDYHDGFESMTFSIRLGEIGLIICFEDNGIQQKLTEDYLRKFRDISLHPIQFDELVAKVTYSELIRERIPSMVSITPVGQESTAHIIALPLQGCSTKPIYGEWIQRDYAKILYQFWRKWGIKFEDIYIEPNQVLTLLLDENDNVIELNSEGYRI